mmetsp:Transcript_3428/g.12040  ORF Transcript_3428/g.12040 Transcript_3428/m.12040 type:complete len:534 (+) Transcript_3428:75-1676(+)
MVMHSVLVGVKVEALLLALELLLLVLLREPVLHFVPVLRRALAVLLLLRHGHVLVVRVVAGFHFQRVLLVVVVVLLLLVHLELIVVGVLVHVHLLLAVALLSEHSPPAAHLEELVRVRRHRLHHCVPLQRLGVLVVLHVARVEPLLEGVEVLDGDVVDAGDGLAVVLEDELGVELPQVDACVHALQTADLNVLEGEDEEGLLRQLHQAVHRRLDEDERLERHSIEAQLLVGDVELDLLLRDVLDLLDELLKLAVQPALLLTLHLFFVDFVCVSEVATLLRLRERSGELGDLNTVLDVQCLLAADHDLVVKVEVEHHQQRVVVRRLEEATADVVVQDVDGGLALDGAEAESVLVRLEVADGLPAGDVGPDEDALETGRLAVAEELELLLLLDRRLAVAELLLLPHRLLQLRDGRDAAVEARGLRNVEGHLADERALRLVRHRLVVELRNVRRRARIEEVDAQPLAVLRRVLDRADVERHQLSVDRQQHRLSLRVHRNQVGGADVREVGGVLVSADVLCARGVHGLGRTLCFCAV